MNYSWSPIVRDYSFLKIQSTKFKLICQYRKEKTTLVKVYIGSEAFYEVEASRVPRKFSHEGDKIVSPKSRLPLLQ
jgi:hypothetical protein